MDRPSPKIDALESLRGLAALSVAVGHFQIAFAPTLGFPDKPWGELAGYCGRSGRWMVAIFFVLSGFVLARSYLLTGRREVLAAAAVRRYPRLVLPCLVAVLAAYALLANGLMHNQAAAADVRAEFRLPGWFWLESLYSTPPAAGAAVKEATWGMFFGFDAHRSYNVNLWTMAAELLGSFVVFGCLGVFGRGRPLAVGGGVAAAVCYLNGWSHVALFLAGMLLSEAHRLSARRLPFPAAAVLAAGAVYAGGHYVPLTLTMPLSGHVYTRFEAAQAAAAVAVVAAVAFSPLLSRLLSARPLVFLGSISFGLYLVHVPLLASLSCYQYVALRAAGWEYAPAAGAAFAVYLPLTLLGGYVMYHVADRPGVWLSRKLTETPSRPPAADAAPPAARRRSLFARLAGTPRV